MMRWLFSIAMLGCVTLAPACAHNSLQQLDVGPLADHRAVHAVRVDVSEVPRDLRTELASGVRAGLPDAG